MANRAASFTQADVTRAVKGARAAGLEVREVIATAKGVRVIIGNGRDDTAKSSDWDKWLDEENVGETA